MGENDFEYIVEKRPPDPCCFGSKIERDTTPIGKGLSPFQKRATIENYTKIAPGYYDYSNYSSMTKRVLLKMTSRRGFSSLANTAPRFEDRRKLITPSSMKYAPSLTWAVVNESEFPFGSRIERNPYRDDWNPGPGVYDITGKKCRRTRFNYNFGHPAMIDTLDMFCVPNPVDVCHKCKELCDGDYWCKDSTLFLCHLCWLEERYTQEIYNKKQLKQFKKIRNCSFLHQHEGTHAAIHLLPRNKLKKRIRLENYLDLYLKCY